MLPNLIREMKSRRISINAYALALGITEEEAQGYIANGGDMPLHLLRKTGELFPGCSLSYLFYGGSGREDPAEFFQKV